MSNRGGCAREPEDSAVDPAMTSFVRITGFLLTGIALTALAQDEADVEARYEPDETPTCNVASASRTREACAEEAPTVLRSERELRLRLELAAPQSLECESSVDLKYFQRDTFARVTGMIENETCTASSGTFEIEARVEEEDGERRALVFSESWERNDDQPVEFSAEYPIGEDVYLVRLRARGLSCTCAEPVTSAPDPNSARTAPSISADP
jgi:hypothetical protein